MPFEPRASQPAMPWASPKLQCFAGLCWLLSATACPGNFVKSDRATPVCATRNCETGEVVDDGCSADGKCLSCSNDCGGQVAPRNGPASSPMPR